jgi:diguanylate cyclase (GGDEF)-like protein
VTAPATLDPRLERRLLACPALPTAPAVALELLARCGAEDADTGAVTAAVARDPALTAKVLRVANQVSGSRGRIASVAAAAEALGTNALLAVALSFSLARGRRRADAAGLDLGATWRRALASAAGARAVADAAGADAEEAATAALLGDLGLLALHEVARRDHAAACAEAAGDHGRLAALERERVGADHAQAGALLARAWGFPDVVAEAIAALHAPVARDTRPVVACAAVGHLVAWGERAEAHRTAVAAGLPPDAVDRALVEARRAVLTAAPSEDLADPEACDAALARAREILVGLSFRSVRSAALARETVRSLSEKRAALEARSSRDALTGLFTRAHGEAALATQFAESQRTGQPLTVALADVDRFKLVNDGYGHATGDAVLRAVADAAAGAVRSADLVVRWGGDELLLVLPETDAAGAAIVATRVRTRVAAVAVPTPADQPLRVTLSLGHATRGAGSGFGSVAALLEGADAALYAAKRGGRDRSVGT